MFLYKAEHYLDEQNYRATNMTHFINILNFNIQLQYGMENRVHKY